MSDVVFGPEDDVLYVTSLPIRRPRGAWVFGWEQMENSTLGPLIPCYADGSRAWPLREWSPSVDVISLQEGYRVAWAIGDAAALAENDASRNVACRVEVSRPEVVTRGRLVVAHRVRVLWSVDARWILPRWRERCMEDVALRTLGERAPSWDALDHAAAAVGMAAAQEAAQRQCRWLSELLLRSRRNAAQWANAAGTANREKRREAWLGSRSLKASLEQRWPLSPHGAYDDEVTAESGRQSRLLRRLVLEAHRAQERIEELLP